MPTDARPVLRRRPIRRAPSAGACVARRRRRLRAAPGAALGPQRDRRRVDVSLNLSLDRAGHFSAQALYVDGDASAKLEDEAYWSLGLGVNY